MIAPTSTFARRPMALTILGMACIVTTAAARPAQTQPPRDAQAQAAAGTAVIAGLVTTDEQTPRPVRRALVTLSGGSSGHIQAVTDDGGRFAFAGLRAGRYTLAAEKPAHVKAYYGSKRVARGPGTLLAIADGQRVTDVVIRLLRGAVIEGTVVDENGFPVSSAQVRAQQPVVVNGERRFISPPVSQQWATTDDRGRYRLYGLPPGEYVVRSGGGGSLTGGDVRLTTAAAIEATSGTPGSGTVHEAPHVTRAGVFFPGVADAVLADVITLAAGEERTGVDIRSALVRASRIEGTIVGPSGQPIRNVLIGLANVSAGSMWGSPGIIRPGADGRFTLSGLTPGRYLFFGRGTEGDAPATPAATLPLWAETEVTVAEADVLDVVVQFSPGVSVSGRLAFQGTQPAPDASTLRLTLGAVPSIAGAAVSLPPLSPQQDGSFTFRGVAPGRYRLAVSGSVGWSLRAAMLNGADVLDTLLEVHTARDVRDIVVTLTDRPSEITGTLVDELGRPTPEYGLVVFSTDRQHWTRAPRRLSGIVKVASDGRFSVTGLPPGEYFLAALTDLDPSQVGEPTFLEQLATVSLKLSLGEGERKVQDLKIR
jgi:protocatechuate 3,4-dioxygenase beta subunit